MMNHESREGKVEDEEELNTSTWLTFQVKWMKATKIEGKKDAGQLSHTQDMRVSEILTDMRWQGW